MSLTQVEQARFNMIEQQIRTWEVLDAKVLDLLMHVPREEFVPTQYKGLAFADLELPIGHGQFMLSPKMEARILQSLEIKPTDKVLEIGTGSGYLTALIAKQAKEVISVEIDTELMMEAKIKLAAAKIQNVSLVIGDAANGWLTSAPYDVIVFTGSLALEPTESVLQTLNNDGRLFAVVGQEPAMQAMMIKKVSEGCYKRDVLFETCIPQLKNVQQPQRFEF